MFRPQSAKPFPLHSNCASSLILRLFLTIEHIYRCPSNEGTRIHELNSDLFIFLGPVEALAVSTVSGIVWCERAGETLWERPVQSGTRGPRRPSRSEERRPRPTPTTWASDAASALAARPRPRLTPTTPRLRFSCADPRPLQCCSVGRSFDDALIFEGNGRLWSCPDGAEDCTGRARYAAPATARCDQPAPPTTVLTRPSCEINSYLTYPAVNRGPTHTYGWQVRAATARQEHQSERNKQTSASANDLEGATTPPTTTGLSDRRPPRPPLSSGPTQPPLPTPQLS